MLASLIWRLPRLSLIFYLAILLYFGILCHAVTFFISIETSDMTQVSLRCAANVGGINTGGWGGAFPGLLMV